MGSQLPSPPTEKRLSLMDLPEEILEQIVFHVADQDRLAIYRDVVYVNKGLNRITSPHVARHSPIHCMNPKVPPTPTHLLLLHLFRHPEHAKNVRTLFTKSYDEDILQLGERREYLGGLTDVESFEKIAVAAQETCPELANSSQWCRQLSDGDVDASVALLLAWCTRIVKLDYEMPLRPNMMEQMTLRLVNMTAKNVVAGTKLSLHPLSQLEHVVLRASDTCHWDDHRNIVYAAPFFYLPTVKSLTTSKMGTGHALQDTSNDGHYWVARYSTGHTPLDPALYISKFPVGTSPIETLILDDASFRQPGFLVLVRACQRLKKLAIHTDRYMIFMYLVSLEVNNREVAGLEDLSKAITYHSSSLEEVTFGFKDRCNWSDFRHYHKTTAPLALYDCLKNMQRLKRLTIHIEFLYKKITDYLFSYEVELVTDRLPPTLEHLVLERHKYVDSSIISKEMELYRTLLEQCGPGGRFSKLQTLTLPICYWRTEGNRSLEELDELEVLAGSKGVLIIFGWEHGDDVTPLVSEPYPLLQQCSREQSDWADLTSLTLFEE